MRQPRARARERPRESARPLPPPAHAPRATGWAARDTKRHDLRRCSWLYNGRTVSVLNAFVMLIVICNASFLLWSRLSPSAASKTKHQDTRTHAGYVQRRSIDSAGAAAIALGLDTTSVQRVRLERVYAIAQRGCRPQWLQFARRAHEAHWPIVRWPCLRASQVRLAAPPIELAADIATAARTAHRTQRARLRRSIAYLDAHRRAWIDMTRRGAHRALLIDQHLFVRDAHLHNVLDAADEPQLAWHVLLLRQVAGELGEQWAQVHGTRVVRVRNAIGAAAYVLSSAGAHLLLDNVDTYRGSMDEEFARLQTEMGADFVVLTACVGGSGCDEASRDITLERVAKKYSCVWRRFEEHRLRLRSRRRHSRHSASS